MTAIVSPSSSSPATSPPALSASTLHNPNLPSLPPPMTSPPSRRSTLPRPMSHASRNRLSQYSAAGSIPPRSRPASHVFSVYPSSLSYAFVRDFAYAPSHPLHYGAPPEPSRPPSVVTPSIDSQFSDPPFSWETRTSWDEKPWDGSRHSRSVDIPPIYLADGPPWSEDEDLQSPVVSSRHRKHKSTSSAYPHSRSRPSREMECADAADAVESAANGAGATILSPENFDRERGFYVSTGGDGSERYYVNQGDEANGPGGEFVTYPPDQARHSTQSTHRFQIAGQPPRNYGGYRPESDASSPISSPDYREDDQSRYSRDYQFTITSPDEEMHGKAVALFDFERENENELPLVEGQIIWVSYRYGQGWLVAMDPKTQESGLVPEEYVRLLRDIEGGMTSLTGQAAPAEGGSGSPNEAGTPTQAEHQQGFDGHTPAPSSASNGYHQPIVSTFSTSSKDLDPYPQHLLGTQAGQIPPQVIHYHGQRGGSQANTPTLLNHQDAGILRRSSQDLPAKKGEVLRPSSLGLLPVGLLPDEAVEEAPTASHEETETYEKN